MRKILLGTTAVVTAVLAGVPMASAQEAPTVRIGGSIQAYGGYIQQSSSFSEPNTNFTVLNATGQASAATTVTIPTIPGVTTAPTTITVPANNRTVGAPGNFARLGKFDLITIPQISFIVTGKLANGLTYGGNIDLTFNNQEGRVLTDNRVGVSRTAPAIDEAYVFVAHPRFGQVRFGDEDGVMGGLMNSGWLSGFGSGGVFGVWENFQTRQGGNRTQNAPGGLGDNSKIVYMTPQFFGFDAGVSYAPNYGSGGQHGCVNDTSTSWCDRAYAFRGATGAAIPIAGGEQAARRNEWQTALRYRGSFSGVGVSATVGWIHAGAANDLTNLGAQVRTLSNMNILQAGAQMSFMGATVGAMYQRGDFNFFWGNPVRGDRSAEQLVLGATYTSGPITVGVNYTNSLVEGGNRFTFDSATGLLSRGAAGRSATGAAQSTNLAMMRRWGLGIGGNYRLAPGLDLIAEYVHHSIRERGRDLDAAKAGIQDRSFTNVFILGTRLAF
jgi:predicted porin